MGSDDGTIVVLLLKIGYGLFQQGIARPTTVVSCGKFEVSLALDTRSRQLTMTATKDDACLLNALDQTQAVWNRRGDGLLVRRIPFGLTFSQRIA